MDTDRIIADIASAQHSVVTRAQLLERGVSTSALDRRLADGRLVRMHSGIYRPDGHPWSWHQTLVAAVLGAGPGAAASHRSAAFLHDLRGVAPRAEVSVVSRRSPRTVGVLVHRVMQLGSPDTAVVEGISCTQPARTLIDLAGVLRRAALETVLDDCLSRRLVSVQYVQRRLDSLGRQGRSGTGTLAELLAQRTGARPRTQSEFERRLLLALDRRDLPVPRTQYEVALPGGRKAFLDFAYPELQLGIEADSYEHHSSRTDWARDRTRNRLLTALGWRILPVTWEDLVPDPTGLIAVVARSLSQKPRHAG
ncbi:MAG TPA: type IV toxin-antitoxin system AbiEi family antitoxin domain-containing protein [Acidimicrobiales bacterium]|nr:type IV toxin-antitoxin system AbiEi family antitoxin domain-containing protein [Acidimicrobiales bacterium]